MRRRTFLKATAVGWRGRAGLRRLEGRSGDARVQDRAHHRDAQHLPLLRRLLRRHHPHPRRQGEERRRPSVVHVEGDPDHPISRGTPLPQGRHAQGRHHAQEPADASRRCAARARTTGRTSPGTTRSRRSRATSRTRATARSSRRTPRARWSTARPASRWIGGCTDTNEFNFLQWKVITALGVPYRDTQARV